MRKENGDQRRKKRIGNCRLRNWDNQKIKRLGKENGDRKQSNGNEKNYEEQKLGKRNEDRK